MKVRDFDDFAYRRRKPWLLLIVVAVAVVILVHRFLRKGAPDVDPARDEAGQVAQQPQADERVTEKPKLGTGRPGSSSAATQPVALPSMAEAVRLEDQGDLARAREAYLALLDGSVPPATRSAVEERLGAVNVRLVTTPLAMPEKIEVVVKRGDSVEKLAKRHGSTVGLIQLGNQIENPHLIKAGDQLRILTGKFSAAVSKTRNDMVVTMDGTFFKRYGVGTGKFGKTPVGTFRITEKIKEPVWWRPDGREVPFGHEENILGTRWMTLRAVEGTPDVRGYGIHGTWNPASIGKAESAGCIRMRNSECEELYALLPVGTTVTIAE